MSRRTIVTATIALAFAAATVACKTDGSEGGGSGSSLSRPDKAAIATPAPDSFRVVFETSKGNFTVLAHRDWAPLGVDRFYHLVQMGFFDDTRFFRVLHGFMAQFGINGDPKVTAAWEPLVLKDDPVKQSNKRGTVSFATGGPDTRTTQLFINYADNANLDAMGFAPIGEVVDGMAVVDSLYGDYGEGAPDGSGPNQELISKSGTPYLTQNFPKLDFIRKARLQ